VLKDPLPIAMSRCIPEKIENVNKKFRLLIAGAISERKGVVETLNALDVFFQKHSTKVELRIVGEFSSTSYRQKVNLFVEEMVLKYKEKFSCVIIDKFVDFQELSNEYSSTDCVLIPYLNFSGSSGIIGHACFHKKTIIACKTGLIGEIIIDRNLGRVVDPQNMFEYASDINDVIECKNNNSSFFSSEYDSHISFLSALIE
jgi:glycosyltransferase involved in cell wall biosynthesis